MVKRALLVSFVVASACMALAGVAPAYATGPAPGWTLSSQALPTNFSSAGNALCASEIGGQRPPCDRYEVSARNAGSEPTDISPITLTDALPSGLRIEWIEFSTIGPGTQSDSGLATLCHTVTVNGASTVTCTLPTATYGEVKPDEMIKLIVYFTVLKVAAVSLTNQASISGGGVPAKSVQSTNRQSSTPAPFGFESFGFEADGVNGLPDTQAGGHPYELTTTFALNSVIRTATEGENTDADSVQDPRDIFVDLPLGFAASTLAAPQCTQAQLSSEGGCPPDTRVGEIVTFPNANLTSIQSAIYNLVPEHGLPGEFGFLDKEKGAHVLAAHVVPTPEGYVLEAGSPFITQASLTSILVTFFGDPAVRDATGQAQIPYFTNPTHCAGGAVKASAIMDSWQDPGTYNADGTPNLSDPAWKVATSESPPVTGCDTLQFDPSLIAQPTTSTADSPSGLEFEMKVPQPEDYQTTSTPSLEDATVTFPEGMTVDPSSGQGLEACSAAQIGWQGGTPENFDAASPECPEASKIGSLELETPLIPYKLEGAIYLAAQNENPFGSVLATYVVVDDPATGVVLKIAGELKSDPTTGRLTAFFPENAQLPFNDLKLHFFSGPRAELATPESCGTFTTTSVLEPWSAPDSGPNAEPFDSFTIDGGCVNGFNPTLTAGSTNLQAGAFTNFVASFSRQDPDLEMGGLSVTLPPGLLANVGSVPECSEAQIAQARAGNGWGCPDSTKVGTVTAGAGPGPNPLFVTGNVYLTGAYSGGPYGLAVVVPAIAGPFHLGNVVVRQSLRIDPYTAQVTDVSDRFPTFLDPVGANGRAAGIPIKLRRVDVDINREGFTFNPTDCSKLAITGSVTSVNGQSVPERSPFQVTNCATLKFEPKFTVSTQGNGTANGNGASLNVKLSAEQGPRAGGGAVEANIAKVDVSLPIALSSRLKVLQKACPEAQFATNPAGCPEASNVGTAIVHTPILAVPLTGPAYFVSHGGEAFPDLVMVLQGGGITVDLVGHTKITGGVTYTKFETVPDAPVQSFELNLPEGPHAILGAIKNLCKPTKTETVKEKVAVKRHGHTVRVTKKVHKQVPEALIMPTEMTGQNGALFKQQTHISVTGCPPTRPKAKPAKKKAKKTRKKR